MAKSKREPVEHAEPDPEVRLTAVMPKSVRFRIRIQAMRSGENVEDLAARWLLERLVAEEKKKHP